VFRVVPFAWWLARPQDGKPKWSGRRLFGPVASGPTTWRLLAQLDGAMLADCARPEPWPARALSRI